MPVLENHILAGLSLDERHRLDAHADEVRLRQGDILTETGTPATFIWFPHDAIASTVVDTVDGRSIEVCLTGCEGFVGLSVLLGRSKSNSTVVTQIPGRATRMRTEDFLREIVEPRGEAYHRLLHFTDAYLSMIAQTAACNSLHTLSERLARWILLIQDRVARKSLPLTQEFVAYMLGVRRATVSLAASDLQNRGLIRYSRGELDVLDRTGLEAASCACYAIVRNVTNSLRDPIFVDGKSS